MRGKVFSDFKERNDLKSEQTNFGRQKQMNQEIRSNSLKNILIMIEKVIDIKWQFGRMENSNSHKINSNFDL